MAKLLKNGLYIMLVLLCCSGCISQKALNTQPVAATTPIPTVQSTPSKKVEIDTSLIEKVKWDDVESLTGEYWWSGTLFSNGKNSFFLTRGYSREDVCMLNLSGEKPLNDICPFEVVKSHLPGYYAYVSYMEGDKVELRYFPAEKKVLIIDKGHRFDDVNYSGDYSLVIQKIAKYPNGAIIFTRLDNKNYQSVVMIPYVDGSADFVVNEKDTYHCDGHTVSGNIVKERVYKYSKDGKEAIFATSAGDPHSPTYINLSGKLLDDDLWGNHRADSTKY